jgi:hypothetical protein
MLVNNRALLLSGTCFLVKGVLQGMLRVEGMLLSDEESCSSAKGRLICAYCLRGLFYTGSLGDNIEHCLLYFSIGG